MCVGACACLSLTRRPAADGRSQFKSWFDRSDTWASVLTNSLNQVRVAEYQGCGRFNMPDMLTIGMGGQTPAQYRAQMFLWAVLGAPLVMGHDVRHMDNATRALLANPEVIAVAQDRECIQGSLSRAVGAAETWIKPLHDGDFAVVLLNKDSVAQSLSLNINGDYSTCGTG